MPYTSEIGEQRPTSPTPDQESREVFDLLDDFCSNEQLRNLIRQYRPAEGEYTISGNRDSLRGTVQKLFNTGHISRQRLDEVLERAEENGRQHIFLYVPTDDQTRRTLSDFAAMESSLLDGQTRKQAGLPKFLIHPRNVVIADMRREERPGTKYWWWIFKLYAGSERWEVQGKPELHEDEKIVRYRLKYRREVVLIKWHSFGLLELRIPSSGSVKQVAVVRIKLLNSLLARIQSAARVAGKESGLMSASVEDLATDFSAAKSEQADQKASIVEVSARSLAAFTVPVQALDAEARSKDIKWIGVSGSDYDLDGHRVRVEADDEHEDMYQNEAVATALEKVTDCTRLDATIHLREQPDFPEKLGVSFCPNDVNEIRIGSQTSPEAVEFIIRRVWERAKGTTPLPPSPADAIVADGVEKSAVTGLDFPAVSRQYPYLANAMSRLMQWVYLHPSAEYVDPRRLQQDLGTGLHLADIAVAVSKLMEEGLIERKYRVRPSKRKAFLPRVFESLEEVLAEEIKDENGEVVDLHVAEVVPVYGKAGTSSA